MIRKWFILGILSVILLALLYNFGTRVLMYHPFAAMPGGEKAAKEKVKSEDVFKPAWGREIRDKNLFSSQRSFAAKPKPEPQPVQRTAPPETEVQIKPNINLAGIILNQFEEYVALIQIDNEEPVPMRKGDMLSGVRVVEATERAVTLKWRGETIKLTMENVKTLGNFERQR